ncbi:MAG: 2-oxoacid:acceptor oxidoreductase family protein, partial [Parvularculaceae bacterium]|nr:2-oxoacid:acceptor oxidoreductase family protein [Parvularculaceae bacterium]
ITMAAHLESKGASVLDFMGFAQKGGTVLSYVRLSASPEQLNQVRIDDGEAQAVIACDLVVGSDSRSLKVMRKGATRAVANTDIMPTADFIRDRNVDFETFRRIKTIKDACGAENVGVLNASEIAARLCGDTVFSNMLLTGYAWQRGLIPLSLDAIMRAIELNGVAVAKNKFAFSLGRAAAVNIDIVEKAAHLKLDAPEEPSLDEIITRRAEFLAAYQNSAYAARYRDFVDDIRARTSGASDNSPFIRAVAKNLFKLMAYKDEYEVARLYTDGAFRKKLASEFEGDYRLKFHMAPPVFNAELDDQGRPKKKAFGPWMYGALSMLKHFKFLRGTPFDPFGAHEERKIERRLIDDYRARISSIAGRLDPDNLDAGVAIASAPDDIRGYGPEKLQSIEASEQKLARLLDSFEKSAKEDAAA